MFNATSTRLGRNLSPFLSHSLGPRVRDFNFCYDIENYNVDELDPTERNLADKRGGMGVH